jgi:hypothetical protein
VCQWRYSIGNSICWTTGGHTYTSNNCSVSLQVSVVNGDTYRIGVGFGGSQVTDICPCDIFYKDYDVKIDCLTITDEEIGNPYSRYCDLSSATCHVTSVPV